MQALASWLVARPLHGVLGLAFTLLLPQLSSILSGIVMVSLVLALGAKIAAIQAIVAGGLLAGFALLLSESPVEIIAYALIWWTPVFLLAALARQWRSMTLTLQVSVIVAIAAVLGFYIVLGDPAAFWTAELNASIELARQAGLHSQADVLEAGQEMIVPQMTMLIVFFCWSFFAMVLLLGYAFLQALPEKKAIFGRFCDLNFGRVLASIMAVASIGAVVTSAGWLQNLSFVAFAVFWLQGLAVLHWLNVEQRLPVFVLIAIYALLPFLNVLLVISFAVVGYMDAWFDFRARAKLKDNRI